MKKEALIKRQNALRLAWVLYNSVGESELKQLAKILNYEVEQLRQDTRDLQAYLDELDERIDELEEKLE